MYYRPRLRNSSALLDFLSIAGMVLSFHAGFRQRWQFLKNSVYRTVQRSRQRSENAWFIGAVPDLRREVPVPATKESLDYQLSIDGRPQVIVEAKALRHSITDQHAAQCVQYAAILGIRWCLITNGTGWALYDAHAKGPLADKKVAEVALGQSEQEIQDAWNVLSLFRREALTRTDPFLPLLISRVIQDEMKRPDSGVVLALQRPVKTRYGERVTGQEVMRSLRLLIDGTAAPVPPREAPPAPAVQRPPRSSSRSDELIRAGLLPPDATLESTVQGITHIGRLVDGALELNGQRFSSLSRAAGHLRGGTSVNGWLAWRYRGESLADLRSRVRPDNGRESESANSEA